MFSIIWIELNIFKMDQKQVHTPYEFSSFLKYELYLKWIIYGLFNHKKIIRYLLLLRSQQITSNTWIEFVFLMISTRRDFKLILYKKLFWKKKNHIDHACDVIHDQISNMYIDKLFSLSYIIFPVIGYYRNTCIIFILFFSAWDCICLYPTWDWLKRNTLYITCTCTYNFW